MTWISRDIIFIGTEMRIAPDMSVSDKGVQEWRARFPKGVLDSPVTEHESWTIWVDEPDYLVMFARNDGYFRISFNRRIKEDT